MAIYATVKQSNCDLANKGSGAAALISNSFPSCVSYFMLINQFFSNLVVILLLKSIYELKIIHFKWIMSTLVCLMAVKSLIYFKTFRRHLNLLKSQRVKASQRDFMFQTFNYFFELPLSLFALFCYTQVYYIKSISQFYSLTLLFSSIYFSLIGMANIVLIENLNLLRLVGKQLLNSKSSSIRISLLFSFLFRYFYFASGSICFILTLSTYNDGSYYATDADSSSPLLSYKLFKDPIKCLLVYLALNYAIYNLVWFLKRQQASSGVAILRGLFESYKMLIDYNHLFFQSSSSSSTSSTRTQHFKLTLFSHRNTKMINKNRIASSLLSFKLKINLDAIRKASFFIFKIAVQLLSTYFWYFRAIYIYSTNQGKHTLFSLLTGLNTRISLYNLYELEEKIKLRQMALVIVIGCIILSMLCYFIYYSFYFILIKADESDQLFAKHQSMISGGVSLLNNNYNNNYNNIKKTMMLTTTRDSSSVSDEQQILSPENLQIKASSMHQCNYTDPTSTVNLNGTSLVSAYVDHPIDGFSFSTYEQSSSISSSPTKREQLYSNVNKKEMIRHSDLFRMAAAATSITAAVGKNQIFTSDLDVYELNHDDNQTSSSSCSISLDRMQLREEATQQYQQHQQHHLKNLDDIRVKLFQMTNRGSSDGDGSSHLDYETSSGIMTTTEPTTVATTTTSSSSSCSSLTSVFDNSNYLRSCEQPMITTTNNHHHLAFDFRSKSLKEFNNTKQQQHSNNPTTNKTNNQCFQDKVMNWFNKNNRFQLQQQQQQQTSHNVDKASSSCQILMMTAAAAKSNIDKPTTSTPFVFHQWSHKSVVGDGQHLYFI